MKTAMVTGACGAIGRAITFELARRNYSVIMICRDSAAARNIASEIIEKTKNKQVRFETADLSRISEIKNLARRIQEPVDVLINNAASTPRQRQITPEGIEIQFASNVLNYFWMSLAFHDHLKRAAPSRIVNVASFYAGGLDLDDLQFIRRGYNNDSAYRQSKQANRMLTVAFAEKFRPDRISVNACHPGVVNSKLSNSMGFGGSETAEQGAATPVWLAVSDEGQNKTGKWFGSQKESICEFARDKVAIQKLFEICMGFSRELESE